MNQGNEWSEDDTMCADCPAANEPLGVPCPFLLDGEDCPTHDMADE